MKINKTFAPQDLAVFEPESKVGLLATINEEGLPHLTLLTSLQARDTQTVIFGQFTEGRSKKYITTSPLVGFMIMTLDRKLWRGKARWTHCLKEGDEYEMYNRKPMFRYNAYLNIHTVHYMDLFSVADCEDLPLLPIGLSLLLSRLAKGRTSLPGKEQVMTDWSVGLFNQLASLKFISFIGEDGYPAIIPLLSCLAVSDRRLLFSPLAYKKELALLTENTKIAILAMSLDMTSVLIGGTFKGFQKKRHIRTGTIDLEWVYNSMPPVAGQIYPPVPLRPVTVFD